jgi:hypothetical protein
MQVISVDYLIAAQENARRFEAAEPGLIDELKQVNADLEAHGRYDNFYRSLLQAYDKWGSLTERQVSALRASLKRYHERNARIAASRKARPVTAPVPQGRVTVTGMIRNLKWVENDFGGALKMLVESDFGWRVWGTCPAGLAYAQGGDVEVGDRVQFDAAVTRKEADFGFFSRPTKACIVARKAQAEAAPQEEVPMTPAIAEAAERPIHFAPVAPDVKPEDLLPKSAPVPVAPVVHNDIQARPDGDTRAERTEARRKPVSLTDLVRAAGYTE